LLASLSEAELISVLNLAVIGVFLLDGVVGEVDPLVVLIICVFKGEFMGGHPDVAFFKHEAA